MKKLTKTEIEDEAKEKKVTAALHALSCARCHRYTAFPQVDKTKPAERVEWTLSKANHFNLLHPLKEQTGKEFCYLCGKIESKLVAEVNA